MIDIENSDIGIPEYTYSNVNFKSSLQNNISDFGDFFEHYMLKNKPCIIQNVVSDWECAKKWVTEDEINYDYMVEEYGDMDAPVANCKNIQYNAQCKSNMKVHEFLKYLQCNTNNELLYLKDWHLRKNRPNDKFYEILPYFAMDWLNEFALDNKDDDFMFVYIGPQGSRTPLHEDVYCSYSWSVNIVGRKKWILFPPGEEDKLKDRFGNLPLLFEPEKHVNVKYYEIIQEKGDALFVPSGWHHQVANELNTISINHNWINGCNIEFVWKALQKCLVSVENQIAEFKDTSEYSIECQLILKSLFGMDFQSFLDFLCYIAKKRMSQLQGESNTSLSKYSLGINIIKFDLKNILKVMNSIQVHPVFQKENILSSIKNDLLEIRTAITKVL
ncbi:unnamed protein product [Chrysodeixis includens]|uniref:Jumonji domain-containing protein 4 n=1 Tax=Chrysodeixis includens TaxID=689277 RepID=A0A9N8PZ24_CHRIL|nr:unnamed protein product [Chrysodeixis includens]